jgi:hypothetical protein
MILLMKIVGSVGVGVALLWLLAVFVFQLDGGYDASQLISWWPYVLGLGLGCAYLIALGDTLLKEKRNKPTKD